MLAWWLLQRRDRVRADEVRERRCGGGQQFKQGLLEYRAKKVTRGESFHRAKQDILRTGVGSLASAKNSTLAEYLTY